MSTAGKGLSRKPGSRPTMSDVAALAGLHPSSISLALRNSPDIPEATRERVRRIAEELGYRRDPLLETFNFRRRTTHVGHPSQSVVFVSDAPSWDHYDAQPFRRDLLEGVTSACRGGGIGFDRFLFGPGLLTANRLQQILRTRSTDGIVVGPLCGGTRSLALDWSRYNTVGLETFDFEPGLDLFASNFRQAGMLAVEEMVKLGYRRLGCVLPPSSRPGREALLRLGILTARECCTDAGHVAIFDGPSSAFRPWLARHPVEALLASDVIAAAEYCLRDTGVPFSVLDIGDAPEGTAGIRHHHAEAGARAVAALVQKRYINQLGLPRYPICSFVPVEWVQGALVPLSR